MNNKTKKLVRFQDWFEPNNPQHIEWARQYLTAGDFEWERVVPQDQDFQVYPLGNCYGIREHILHSFASAWIVYKLTGEEIPAVTH